MAQLLPRFCSRCGTEAIANQKFCPKCGLNMSDEALPQSPIALMSESVDQLSRPSLGKTANPPSNPGLEAKSNLSSNPGLEPVPNSPAHLVNMVRGSNKLKMENTPRQQKYSLIPILVLVIVCVVVTVFVAFGQFWEWTGFSHKTLWDWLQLLIIPIVISIGGFYLYAFQEYKARMIAQAQTVNEVAKADAKDIQGVAALQLEISNRYYESALQQSQRSFLSALVWAGIGTTIIIMSVIYLMVERPSDFTAYGSLIGGTVVEAIAGLNFYLYGRATSQLTNFQAPLDRIGRFLIANSICEHLEGEIKSSTRAKLVETIASVSTITGNEENEENASSRRIRRSRISNSTRKK